MEKNKTFLVRRPYVTPHTLVIIAKSEEKAIKKAHSTHGHATGTTAKEVKRSGIILSI